MAKRKLTTTVHVKDPHTGEFRVFGPGDDLPSWAEKLITNPAAWDDGPSTLEPAVGDSADAGDSGDYSELNVEQLKEVLASRELPVSGSKAELRERLEADDQAKA